MSELSQAAAFLIQTLAQFFAGLLLLRFWLQLARVGGRNPLSAFVQPLTNFVVLPARRVIPGLWGLDLSTLLLAWLTLVLEAALLIALGSGMPDALVLLLGLVLLLRLAVYLAIGAILVMAVLSWVNPASPMYDLFNVLTRPLLRPIRRVVPPIGTVDLSPLIALLILQLILMLPLVWLERAIL